MPAGTLTNNYILYNRAKQRFDKKGFLPVNIRKCVEAQHSAQDKTGQEKAGKRKRMFTHLMDRMNTEKYVSIFKGDTVLK